MKKIAALITALILVFSLSTPAMADVILEPVRKSDEFLNAHMQECTRIWHIFEVQSETKRCKSPQDDTELGVLSAGETVRIAFEWNGWGLVEYSDSYGGWVELGTLRQLFDSEEFHARYGEEITNVDGELYIEVGREVKLYPFPGSEWRGGSLQAYDEDQTVVNYIESWTDPQGREWGYVSYYYTAKGWVCISNPYGETEPMWPEYADEELSPSPERLPAAVIALVAAAVAATAVLIVVFIRKGKKNAAQE